MKFPIRFYCALGVSAALLAFLPRFVLYSLFQLYGFETNLRVVFQVFAY